MFTPLESAVPGPAPTVLDIPTLITPRKEHPKPTGLVIATESCYPTPPASHESRQPSFDDKQIPTIDVTNASPVDDDFDSSMYVSPERYMENSPVAEYDYCTGLCRDDPLVRFRVDTARAGVNVVRPWSYSFRGLGKVDSHSILDRHASPLPKTMNWPGKPGRANR
jgi:hypothetical protein